MVQHKVKQKVKLPPGVGGNKNRAGTSSGMVQKKGPKRGVKQAITPKNPQQAKKHKVQKEVTKVINKQNEEMIAARAAGPSK